MPEDLLPSVTMKGGSTPLVNTTALTDRLAVPLKQLLGGDKVVAEFPPATGSEDCHLLMGDHKDIPFAFLIVGVADPQVFAEARKQGKFCYPATTRTLSSTLPLSPSERRSRRFQCWSCWPGVKAETFEQPSATGNLTVAHGGCASCGRWAVPDCRRWRSTSVNERTWSGEALHWRSRFAAPAVADDWAAPIVGAQSTLRQSRHKP